jgi:hypothetical protein
MSSSKAVVVVSSNQLSENDRSKLERLKSLYGDNLSAINVLPNMSSVENQHPSGVAYVFASGDSPAFTAPFHPATFMTAGTAVFTVTGGSMPVTIKEIENAKNKIKSLFEGRPNDGLSLAKRDPHENTDKKGTTYFGLFPSGTDAEISLARGVVQSDEDNTTQEKNFIVVSASLPDMSKELYQKIVAHQKSMPPKDDSNGPSIYTLNRSQSTTLKMSDLVGMPEMIYAEAAGKRNRAALAAEVAHALGLTIDLMPDPLAGSDTSVFIGNPLTDVSTYTLQQIPTGEYVYYADAINTNQIRGWAPFKLAPTMGTLLIQGRCDASHPVGAGWSNEYANAYPSSVGRRCSVLDAYCNASNRPFHDEAAMQPLKRAFCWSGSLPFNDKVDPQTFNPRNSRFKDAEAQLGRDHKCTEVQLFPVVAYMEGTPERKIKG